MTLPIPIIIDCDPGQDDAINLLLAMASPEDVNILGITAVAGNAPLSLTQRNARLICELAGRSDIPVHAGCSQPMQVSGIDAEHVHGKTGIDGLDVHEPQMPLAPSHAVDFIVEAAMGLKGGGLTIVATGPLTNVAMALLKQPDIKRRIARIVLMGGALREGGNITPSAEFNMRADPHAAQTVIGSGLPIVMIGLDVTHQMLVSEARLAQIGGIANPAAQAVHAMLSFSERFDLSKYGTDGAPLHDPCTMLYVLDPAAFSTKACNVVVETASPLSLGHTAVDFWGVTGAAANVEWAYDINSDRAFSLLVERLSRYSDVGVAEAQGRSTIQGRSSGSTSTSEDGNRFPNGSRASMTDRSDV